MRSGSDECERSSDDALELLLKCELGDVVDLETIVELAHPEFAEDAFSAAGGLGLVEALIILFYCRFLRSLISTGHPNILERCHKPNG